jgi:hypothetical protein
LFRKTSVSVSTSELTSSTRVRLTPEEIAKLNQRYPTPPFPPVLFPSCPTSSYPSSVPFLPSFPPIPIHVLPILSPSHFSSQPTLFLPFPLSAHLFTIPLALSSLFPPTIVLLTTYLSLLFLPSSSQNPFLPKPFLLSHIVLHLSILLSPLTSPFRPALFLLKRCSHPFPFYLHCKKSLSIFPSPAGMSMTKLSLAGKNLIIPGQGKSVTPRLAMG